MMAITTSTSISVKPRRRSIVADWITATPSSFLVQLRQVPDLDRMIAASRDQDPAVGAERQAADEAGMAAEVEEQLAGAAVPDFHGAVLPRRGYPPALVVGAERQGVDLPVVPPEGEKFSAGLHVPDLDRVLLAPRRQAAAVRAEGHVQARPGDAPAQGEARFLLLVEALRVPELHDPVAARRSQVNAVAAEDQCADCPFVVVEPADLLAGASIPHLHDSIGFSRDQVAAVGGERHGAVHPGDFSRCAREAEDLPCGPRVPDPNGIEALRGDEMTFGVPGHTEDNSPVAAVVNVAAEPGAHPAGLSIPDPHKPVHAGRNNPPAVGAERHAADLMAVLGEGQGFLAGLVPPEWGP